MHHRALALALQFDETMNHDGDFQDITSELITVQGGADPARPAYENVGATGGGLVAGAGAAWKTFRSTPGPVWGRVAAAAGAGVAGYTGGTAVGRQVGGTTHDLIRDGRTVRDHATGN